MGFLPINLKMDGRRAVVVGGGEVALRKCTALLKAGARVTLVSPSLHPELAALRERGELEQLARGYMPGDLAGASIAFAASDDPAVNRAVGREAGEAGIPVALADAPELG